MKLAIVSHSVPPASAAHPALIFRLLKDADPESYCLISQRINEAQVGYSDPTMRLQARSYRVASLSEAAFVTRGAGPAARTARAVLIFPDLAVRTKQILSIVTRERSDAVVALTGDLLNLPAASIASRIARIPFVPYVCDYYSRQWVKREDRATARLLERLVMSDAECAIVLNEFMQDILAQRFGLCSTVIRNPCDLSLYEADRSAPAERGDGSSTVVYTGAVSPAQADALQNLVAASRLLTPRISATPHIYTAQSRETLSRLGLNGHFVHHEHVPYSTVPSIQRRAGVLFLPLAFRSPYPEIVRTSAPFKLGEYLASRRPILVHAPTDSFLAWYFRQHECGLVVTESDSARLAEALERLINDKPLQSALTERAWALAQAEFGIETAQNAFFHVMQQVRAR